MKNNKLKIIVITALAFVGLCRGQNHHRWDDSPYFNTTFLANYNLVEKTLIQQSGFEKITFPSTDGLMLSGLLLTRPNAKATIVFCAGFFPGRKEGQSPIIRMLPPEYNILLFDARGHAQSEGTFWTNLGQYGTHEHKDILGALNLVRDTVGGPIVLFGICSGAFHATHALIKLSQEKKLADYNVQGLVFDSGFVSCLEVTKVGEYHLREKILPGMLSWYANKKTIRNTYFYKLSAFSLTLLGQALLKLFVLPGVRKYEPDTNLADKMHTLDCPVLFIHSKDDNYAPFEQTKALADSVKHKTCWWIEHSSHALHALKHKHEYRKQLLSFLKEALPEESIE